MPKGLSNERIIRIGGLLEEIRGSFDHQYLPTDPVSIVRSYADPRDRELVGLVTALLAFGNAKAIQGSVKKLLEPLGPSPYQALSQPLPTKEFQTAGHRWVRSGDLILLFERMAALIDRYGSLEAFFMKGYFPEGADVGRSLHQFCRGFLEKTGKRGETRGFRFFFPTPENGSACKRLNMFLRWMVRPEDGIDFGLWKKVSPSKLVIPVDIHVFNFARRHHLSCHRTANWKMAIDVTSFLRQLDPADPVKYDFSICHYGMEKGW